MTSEGVVCASCGQQLGRILKRAEGVPLYGVETVRMLLDRGMLTQEGSRYVVAGDVEDLEVPETLQALAAARLDNLAASERALLQDAAVLGSSFTAAAVAAVSEQREAEARDLLDSLVAKQVLGRDDDPRSSEPGSTTSCRAFCGRSRYPRCPGGIARPAIWQLPATLSRRGVRMRVTSRGAGQPLPRRRRG